MGLWACAPRISFSRRESFSFLSFVFQFAGKKWSLLVAYLLVLFGEKREEVPIDTLGSSFPPLFLVHKNNEKSS